jgi:dethiobiotin synthetase
MSVLFVTGIDTGIGKTVACGLLARFLADRGTRVITQKLVQTGGRGLSADIRRHRRLMGIGLAPEDRDGTTCPYVFRFPASPHLAAAREGARIDVRRIARATRVLAARYDCVLIEGVGGLEVPLRADCTTLDYVAERNHPVIVVSSSRLGSINHTLLTLRAAHDRNLAVRGIVYNRSPGVPRAIAEDTRRILRAFLRRHGMQDAIVDLPWVGSGTPLPDIDFGPLVGAEAGR